MDRLFKYESNDNLKSCAPQRKAFNFFIFYYTLNIIRYTVILNLRQGNTLIEYLKFISNHVRPIKKSIHRIFLP